MKQFPAPVKPPHSVFYARKQRLKEILLSAGVGIGIRFFIVIFEFIGVYFTDSSALFFDALSSLLDMLSSVILMLCIRYAARPPDANHPFGHGRLEPLVGLQLGLFLALLGFSLLYQQFFWVREPSSPSISPYAWLFPGIALIALEITYRIIISQAKKHDSPALAADAVHYRIDSLTSFLAMFVLLMGAFYPELSQKLDHFGAFLISIVMVIVGGMAARNNLDQLLDRVPAEEYFRLVQDSAEAVNGVLGTEKIRIQQYGPDAHVDIDIEVDPESSVEIAHKISQRVRAEIQKNWPAVRDVTVHVEPYYPNDH